MNLTVMMAKMPCLFCTENHVSLVIPFFSLNVLQGKVLGTVVGKAAQTSPVPRTNDDGGYGSIPQVLLSVRTPSPKNFLCYVNMSPRIFLEVSSGSLRNSPHLPRNRNRHGS